MKVKVFGLIVLFVVSLVPVVQARQLPPCTNYGCMQLKYMSQVLTGWPNPGGQGCVIFSNDTGRKVRNVRGFQGEDPSTLPGIQNIKYTWYVDCSSCFPPSGNGIAIEGSDPLTLDLADGTFGNYICPVIGGGGGGVN